jgi:hypothetical protein
VREVRVHPVLKSMRIVLLAGVAAVALSACASNRTSTADPVETGSISSDATSLGQLAARWPPCAPPASPSRP